MNEYDTKSIKELDEDMINVFENILESDIEFNFAYGGDENALVVISNSKGPDKEFREKIARSILETLNQPCGFILSDGPDEYSEYTTAYLRLKPEHSYEYVLAPIIELDFDDEEVTSVFHQIYSSSEDETEDNPLVMAATYLYILARQKDSHNNTIRHISNLMNVSEDEIRNNAMNALSKLK